MEAAEIVKRLQTLLLGGGVDRIGDTVYAGPSSVVGTRGSIVHVEQHIHNAVELQKAIEQQPEDSETFAKVAKRKALDTVGGAIQDFAKGQVTEAAKKIVELGKELGPAIVSTAAYTFFKSLGG